MYETINEKVDVIAIFKKGYEDVRPFKVRWHGQDHAITKVGYQHKYRQGKNIIHVFSCTDGASFFQLAFNAAELSWFIEKVWDGETN